MTTKLKHLLYNGLFLVACAAILAFLLKAPPETTKPLPHDPEHQRFQTMGKKEAEQFCDSCHRPDGQKPLPVNHPPTYRCLFCHKQQ